MLRRPAAGVVEQVAEHAVGGGFQQGRVQKPLPFRRVQVEPPTSAVEQPHLRRRGGVFRVNSAVTNHKRTVTQWARKYPPNANVGSLQGRISGPGVTD